MSDQSAVKSRIPEFASVQEAAAFWDSHDSTDFEDEWEPVEFEVSPSLTSLRLLTVELEMRLYKRLRSIAEQQGISAEELAATWLASRLEEAPERASPIPTHNAASTR